ncbi:hypothetical protein LINGRAHAP2_LOCUS10343 [Linum grandiflorum]
MELREEGSDRARIGISSNNRLVFSSFREEIAELIMKHLGSTRCLLTARGQDTIVVANKGSS